MKNIRLTLVLLLTSYLLAASVLAVEPGAGEVVAKPSDEKVEYTLPYPGILPDHPLYPLKVIRDRILEFLIVDPMRKAEFYLLQADKRLNMGIFLFNQNKGALAEQVISKGTKYLVKAVDSLKTLGVSGRESPMVADRLERSMAKQVEVIEELMAGAGSEQRSGLMGSLELVKKLQQEAGKLK